MSSETEKTSRCNTAVLAIDAGGTYLKSMLINDCGTTLPGSFVQVEACARGTLAEIVAAYAELVKHTLDKAVKSGVSISGIGIAVPGPFNYRNGISLMKHKFTALYEVNLGEELRKELPAVSGIPICFRHDANSFLAGEIWRGAARGYARVGGITLGTGLGAACCLDGNFINNCLGSPAPEVSLWSRLYRDGIVEDYVSSRALVEKYRIKHPAYDTAEGAKGIAEAAGRGNADAMEAYWEFGFDLGTILLPWYEQFKPQAIIFGGQIAKAFELFAPSLCQIFSQINNPPQLAPSQLGAEAALYGVAALFRKDGVS